MLSIGAVPYGYRRRRGLGGVALFGVLTLWTLYVSPTVFGQGSGTTTFTTSTTSHTVSGCPARTQQTVTTTVVLGPGTIFVGPNQSVPFFVAAGTQNINTNTDTTTFLCAAMAPALAPGTLAVCAVLLATYAMRRVTRPRRPS